MTYDSTEDRRLETSSAEELRVEFGAQFTHNSPWRCPWCLRPIHRHGAAARALCEQKFSEVMNRRKAGPVRIADAPRTICGEVV